MPEHRTRLDGNAAGGILAEIFESEMTSVPIRCSACGGHWDVGRCHAYLDAPGTVLRCCDCDALLVAIVQRHEVWCVDLRGRFER